MNKKYELIKFCYSVDNNKTPPICVSKKAKLLSEKAIKAQEKYNLIHRELMNELRKYNSDLDESKNDDVLSSDQFNMFTGEYLS